MPRRASIPRKAKYEATPANRTTARITAKLMSDGKRNLADRILRQALARAEAQAKRPGLEVLESALRNATPIIEVKPRRVGGATYQVPVEIRGDRDPALLLLGHPVHGGSALMDLTDLVDLLRVEEDPLGDGGLAGVDVRDDPDVPGAGERVESGHGQGLRPTT